MMLDVDPKRRPSVREVMKLPGVKERIADLLGRDAAFEERERYEGGRDRRALGVDTKAGNQGRGRKRERHQV